MLITVCSLYPPPAIDLLAQSVSIQQLVAHDVSRLFRCRHVGLLEDILVPQLHVVDLFHRQDFNGSQDVAGAIVAWRTSLPYIIYCHQGRTLLSLDSALTPKQSKAAIFYAQAVQFD